MSLALSVVALFVVAFSIASVCSAQSTVFRYWGELEQGSPHSIDGTTFKEAELAFLDDAQATEPWLDIYLAQKHPGASSGNNIDLIYLNQGDISLSLHTGSDAFLFRSTAQSFTNTFTTTRCYDVEFADLDGDGDLDLIRPDWRSALDVGWNNGQGQFTTERLFGAGSPIFNDPNGFVFANGYDDIELGDLDLDGDLDFIAAYYPSGGTGSPTNVIFENLTCVPGPGAPCGNALDELQIVGSGELPSDGTHSVSLADVDRDGFEDALLADSTTDDASVFPVHFGSAGFTFSAPITLPPPPLTGIATYFDPSPIVDFADLDGDTFPDIYVAKTEDRRLLPGPDLLLKHGIHFHTGNPGNPYSGTMELGVTETLEAQIYDARYADLDEDGHMEIVVATINAGDFDYFPTEIFVFQVDKNTRNISNVSASMLPSGTLLGGTAVVLGDLDNDQDLDLVLGGAVVQGSGNIGHSAAAQVYENQTRIFLRNFNITQNRDFTARKTLTAGEQLTIAPGATVTLEATDEIRFVDGFTASAGSEVVARLSS